MTVFAKRIYEEPSERDGARILADRLWPRGIRKEDARLTLWAKEIAPSSELRRALHGGTIEFSEFARRYRRELCENAESEAFRAKVDDLAARLGAITLLTASKDVERSHLVVLKSWLENER